MAGGIFLNLRSNESEEEKFREMVGVLDIPFSHLPLILATFFGFLNNFFCSVMADLFCKHFQIGKFWLEIFLKKIPDKEIIQLSDHIKKCWCRAVGKKTEIQHNFWNGHPHHERPLDTWLV